MLDLPLTTPRLHIRRFRAEDLAPFLALRRDPELARWQSWTVPTETEARRFVAEMALAPWPARDEWLQLAIAEPEGGCLIGDIGIAARAGGAVELGITVARSHQRRGLAREALAALLDAIAAQGRGHLARASIDARNGSSAAMLAALGFVRTAVEPVQWRGEAIEEWHFERRLVGDAASHARLHGRLAALADVLASDPDALGLLALGSVGIEGKRLDAWSDLDFFVLVRDAAAKARCIDRLDWLARAHPLAWCFRNTVDGHKALMADGVLCEFAVFTPEELPQIPFSPGRWVWRRAEVPVDWATPRRALPSPQASDWRVDEALSNLLVGLQRHARGERLAALRMVQVYALDRVLELMEARLPQPPDPTQRDAFGPERRAEQRLAALAPDRAIDLSVASGGYAKTPVAALSLLGWLERHHEVNPAIAARIRALAIAVHPATA
jgi:RimJ/RimL family protein N-acetyltransferase